MRSNSGDGKAKNNNHDPTLRDHEGSRGPAQAALKDHEFEPTAKAPSDHRGSRK
jgi:hypothetical protein